MPLYSPTLQVLHIACVLRERSYGAFEACSWSNTNDFVFSDLMVSWLAWLCCKARLCLCGTKWTFLLSLPPDIRHPEELSLLRKPRDPKKKKKKLEEAEEDDLELEGPLLTPGSGELMDSNMEKKHLWLHCLL